MSGGKQIKGQDLFERQANSVNFNGPLIICDGLQTPENFGAILRTADATGCGEVLLLDSEIDLTHKRISKLSRSTNNHIKMSHITFQEFNQLISKLKKIIALEITDQSSSLFNSQISDCDAVIIGHESSGIRSEVLALCNSAVHLPMYGINGSMNLAQALTVFLYEWRRQQN